MNRGYTIAIFAAAAIYIGFLAACSTLFPPVPGDTRSPEKIVFDDTCWTLQTVEASFKSFVDHGGQIDAKGMEQYGIITTPLDAACNGPVPTDVRQWASKVAIDGAAVLAIMARPKAS